MPEKKKKYLITAALPYANGPVHIGHLAGCYLPADIYARYLRMKGEDVKFICGSDEHGVPITIKARNEGITPQQVVDKYHMMMKDSFQEFGITFDIYSRTTNKTHHETASAFFKTLYDKNVFVEETTEQFYDEEAKQFLADRYIVGTCPKCGNENAYGDQCERCGSSLNPTDLINPHSMLSGSKPVLKKTKNWFLPLDKMEPQIKAYIESKKTVFRPTVYGQCMSWINSGLQPRAMTRDLDWGVKVPVKDAEGKVLYVWFDAPIGYISATKELLPDDWEKYWKKQTNADDNATLIHFIGKDNIVFHCLIFPAMLMAHGEFIVPSTVPANEFLNLEGDKISTSRNWAVWLHEYLLDFPGRQDELRYVLTSIAPETKDSDFSWKDFQARVNNELADILGNFVNRALVLTQKFFGDAVPGHADLQTIDKDLITSIQAAKRLIGEHLDNFQFRSAQTELMNLARAGNKYLADTEPWKLFKADPERVGTILYMALEVTAYLGFLSEPFLPATSGKILNMMKLQSMKGKELKGQILKPRHVLGKAEIIFKKVEDEDIEKQIGKLNATKAKMDEQSAIRNPESAMPQKAETTFEDFSKMDIRAGTIIEAEKVEGTDKLLKLKIDTGIDQRIVVSGIAKFFKPEEIIGKQVSILVNLQPRKLKGIMSQGMILMAENAEGKLTFVSPEAGTENGSNIK